MAVVCPIDFDKARLRAEVQAMYARVASAPEGEFHFHRGPAYAASRLGYDETELSALPLEVTSSFAGVANPHAIRPIPAGVVVVDIGCGAGTDLLLAARRVGPAGRAIGVDMTEAMRQRAIDGAALCGLTNVEVRAGDATRLPVDDRSVDVVISNGVLNLVPEKERAIAEIARVLRPGGRAQIGDIVIGEVLSEDCLRDVDLWTSWIAGALLEAEMIDVFASAGFTDVRITARFECFEGTAKQGTARRYRVVGANLSAIRAASWAALSFVASSTYTLGIDRDCALESGTRVGSYEIVALLGAGGFGEVYRARDLKLNSLRRQRARSPVDAQGWHRFREALPARGRGRAISSRG